MRRLRVIERPWYELSGEEPYGVEIESGTDNWYHVRNFPDRSLAEKFAKLYVNSPHVLMEIARANEANGASEAVSREPR